MSTIAKCANDIMRIERVIPPEMMDRIALVVDVDTWKQLERELSEGGYDIASQDLNFRNIMVLGVPVVMKASDDVGFRA
jgi:hypothetical protein